MEIASSHRHCCYLLRLCCPLGLRNARRGHRGLLSLRILGSQHHQPPHPSPPRLRQVFNNLRRRQLIQPLHPPVARLRADNCLRTAGQEEHRVYDLRPYTGYLTKHDRPEQAVVDWIIRETGSDVWFSEPFGFMNADRDQLSVYHTPEMHQVIAGMVDRFVAGEKDPQVLNLRVMTVGNPNWRSRAEHVNAARQCRFSGRAGVVTDQRKRRFSAQHVATTH